MNDRIKALRKTVKKNQTDFGAMMGVSLSAVQKWESGENIPTDTAISLMCQKTNANENWLRTGEGEMFLPKSRGDEIADIVKAASTVDPEEAAAFFTDLFKGLSDGEIILMYEILRRHFPQDKK